MLVSTPSPPTARTSLHRNPQPREGRNQRGSPKKVSRGEIRPSHSGNSDSSPAVNHRPPCLFPSPRATSVCVYVCVRAPTTQVTQTHVSLTHCWSQPEEPYNAVTKTLLFSWDDVASLGPPSQIPVLVGGGEGADVWTPATSPATFQCSLTIVPRQRYTGETETESDVLR